MTLPRLHTTWVLMILTNLAFGQLMAQPVLPSLHTAGWERDSMDIAWLHHYGVKIEGERIIAWFPLDSITYLHMLAISDTLDKGIQAIERYIHGPHPWQAHPPHQPYLFYFRTNQAHSYASGSGYISIPIRQVKFGRISWLRESIFEVLAVKDNPYREMAPGAFDRKTPHWLHEGMTEYLALLISRQHDWPYYSRVTGSRLRFRDIDIACVREMNKSSKKEYILHFIGEPGYMPELKTDYARYAPMFYQCSCSFIKYLAKYYGLHTLLTSYTAFMKEKKTIEKSTQLSMDALKRKWLSEINVENRRIQD